MAILTRERVILVGILIVFLGLGIYYALGPMYSRPDEHIHESYADYLRSGNGLPEIDLSRQAGSARPHIEMEAHQPPLYYAIVAAIAARVSSDELHLPLANPHFRNTALGNKNPITPNYVASPTEAQSFYAGRFVSLGFGVLALLFSFLLVRLFFAWPIAALATALMAWNPQFLYIASSFSNDMANVATVAVGLWLIGIAMRDGLTLKRSLVLGVLIAIATMAKLGGLGLLLPLGVLAVWQAWQHRRVAPLIWAGVTGCIVLAIDAWWFWRNWQLYHDPFAVNALPTLLGPRLQPFDWHALKQLGEFLWQSYWLDMSLGALNFAEPVVYWLLGLLCLGALLGLVLVLHKDRSARAFFVLAWGWFAFVLISLIRLTSGTAMIMGGGRLLFPAAIAVASTLAVGLTELASRRKLIVAIVPIVFVVYAAIAPVRYIQPAFPQPLVTTTLSQQPAHATAIQFGNHQFELVGYDLAFEEHPEGSWLDVTYYWRTGEGSDKNYSLFLHAVDKDLGRIAQIDTYPSYGTFPTRLWPKNQFFTDHLRLPIPLDKNPRDLRISTGLYDATSMERLSAVTKEGKALSEAELPLAEIFTMASGKRIVAIQGQNELSLQPGYSANTNFGNQVELLGYDMQQRSTASGTTVLDVYAYWKALRNIDQDYSVFLHFIDRNNGQQALVSQLDSYPGNGSLPTSRWREGQVFVDCMSLVLPGDKTVSNGSVVLGMYDLATARRLALVDPQGKAAQADSLPLATIEGPTLGKWKVAVKGQALP